MIERPYWWKAVPSFSDGAEFAADPSAPLPERCDVAIIGGGYTGLAAARYLASIGATVVVLERERIGWGASSRNGGQVLTGLSVEPATLVARYGEARAVECFQASLDAIAQLETLIRREAIDCDYEASGHVQAAWKPSHFASFREEQALLARLFHHRVELLPKNEQRAELGTDVYHGLMIDERSRALDPARYVSGLAEAARRAGATIAERTPVQQVTPRGRRWAVATTRGTIDAGDLLLATNGYSDGVVSVLQRRLIPIGSYIIATEPLEPGLAHSLLPRRRMAFDSKHFLYYFRVTRDHRLIFGGRAEFSRPSPASNARAAAILRRGMVRVFPELANVRVDFAWGGNVAFTRDRLPHAGRLGGAYYAGGYCGHGIAMATALGELIARLIAGQPVTHPLLDTTGSQFPAIPLYSGNPWFLPAAGLYYRWLDAVQ